MILRFVLILSSQLHICLPSDNFECISLLFQALFIVVIVIIFIIAVPVTSTYVELDHFSENIVTDIPTAPP